MVLIYDRMFNDPRIQRLSDSAEVLWIGLIGQCNIARSDTLTREAIDTQLRYAGEELQALLEELASTDLVEPNAETVHVKARLDLWAYDDEVPPEHIA